MAASPITVSDVKVIGLAGPIIAALVTVIRLFERARLKRFGIDDAWAAFSLSILILFVVALFTHLGDPTNLSHSTRVAMYYILAQGFYGIVWTARMSILFSVIRITPTGSNLKKILYGLSASFLVVWSILFSQVFWSTLTIFKILKAALAPQCTLGRNVAIAQLISDIYADSVLIVAPLRLLWNLEVSRSQRNRLFVVFSSSIITTIASLIHAYYVLRVGSLDEVFVAIIEQCVSLLICNLAVIVGIVSRLMDSGKRRFGSSGGQSFIIGRSRGITTIGGTTNGPIDFKTRTTDTETATQLNVLKVVDVHTDAESFPRNIDAKVYHYQQTSYIDHNVA
ncbi:hypothetical protein C0991_007909 [Blastosporella zonata]|nr:hypothetical protein C0991_007909 [Blastosporella zonata]